LSWRPGAGKFPGDSGLLVFLLGLPLVLWVATKAMRRSHRRFFTRIAMALSRRLPEEPRGEMVTLIPGPDLEPIDGFGRVLCMRWRWAKNGTSLKESGFF